MPSPFHSSSWTPFGCLRQPRIMLLLFWVPFPNWCSCHLGRVSSSGTCWSGGCSEGMLHSANWIWSWRAVRRVTVPWCSRDWLDSRRIGNGRHHHYRQCLNPLKIVRKTSWWSCRSLGNLIASSAGLVECALHLESTVTCELPFIFCCNLPDGTVNEETS